MLAYLVALLAVVAVFLVWANHVIRKRTSSSSAYRGPEMTKPRKNHPGDLGGPLGGGKG